MSCIMHSSLVDDLNLVFVWSAYFGFTNSAITPPVRSSVGRYVSMESTREFIFPGNGDHPVESAVSPSGMVVLRKSGSSWLYSTLRVMLEPSVRVSWAMPPMASFGFRGTATEFMAMPVSDDTPRVASTVLTKKALVSWNRTTQRLPSSAKALARPEECISRCTSPWPCGLVSMRPGSFGSGPMRASASVRQATFSCFSRWTWPFSSPK
mmetsp:Transcript_127242/g.341463  ORF Transcript_127242/g.341463 Transcript_127242/m.341463 type:complete len:209 (-) Transcript_127242:206-832(-)